jgi:hypothetical protein
MKLVATAIGVVVMNVQLLACDVCGAVNSSLGLGTVALGNRHSIGLTYQYRTYLSNHPPLFNEPAIHSSERFQRIDLSGNIRLADRWQLKAVIPVVYNEQTREGIHSTKQGLGDPTVTVHYFVIDRQDSLARKNIRWSLGGGGKLPAGAFADPHDEVLLLYPGTGTWDGVVQSALYLRSDKWGLIQETNAVIRSTNKHGYTPGSLFSATLFGFRRFSNWSVFGGFQYAWNGIDYIDRISVNSSPSQGNILSTTIGGTIQWGNILVQANYHLPVAQNLGNGYTTQQTSFTAGIHYIFN